MAISVVVFDGLCNLCNVSINFVIDHDPKQHFKFATLQSKEGQNLIRNNGGLDKQPDSVILIENNKIFTKSTAALRIAKRLQGVWPIFFFLFIWWPSFFRDFIYDIVAKNRYKWFGKRDSCRMPTPDLLERFRIE